MSEIEPLALLSSEPELGLVLPPGLRRLYGGDLTLPEVHVMWWDTVHQQVRTAALPAHTIEVTGTATSAPPAAKVNPVPSEAPQRYRNYGRK